MDSFRFDLAVPGGVWTAAVLTLAFIGIVWLGLAELRRDGRRRRALTLGALRISTAIAALVVALQPTWTGERFTRVDGRLAVLVDTSRSMSVAAEDEEPRRIAAQSVLSRWSAGAGAETATVYAFGGSPRVEALARLSEDLPANDDETRIAGSVREILGSDSGADLGAVVVLSDGADDVSEEDLAFLERSGARVHTIAVGADEELVDDAIATVQADEIAFLRQAARVRVVIRTTRGEGTSIPVALSRGEEVVRQSIGRTNARGEAVVEIPFTPSELGRGVYRLSIPVAPGDAVPQNNERVFLVRVTRDKLRVLLVAGRPSWDERFLRSFLKRDPAIDLISFFILRTGADLTMASPDELALIPFPTDELFSEHLGSFDLVFFQNFEFGPYQMAGYLPRIRDYVLRGGGFAMIGGDLSFGSGGYGETPLSEILPVTMPPGGTPETRSIVTGRFSPQLSSELHRHPLLSLLPDPAANAEAWARLAPLEGANVLTGLARDGQALLHHPRHRLPGGQPMPLLAVGTAGRGRTLALGTDTTHRWGITTGGATGDASAYERFWDRAMRWLTRDPTLDPAQITTDRPRYGVGASVRVTASLKDERYEPIAGQNVRISVLSDDGSEVSFEETTTDANGGVELTLPGPELPGGFRASARLADSAESLAEEGFVVETGGDELAQPAARPETLEMIAARTGGTHHRVADAPDLDRYDTTRTRSLGTTTTAPFASIWAFLFVLALFGAEWALRRAWGRR